MQRKKLQLPPKWKYGLWDKQSKNADSHAWKRKIEKNGIAHRRVKPQNESAFCPKIFRIHSQIEQIHLISGRGFHFYGCFPSLRVHRTAHIYGVPNLRDIVCGTLWVPKSWSRPFSRLVPRLFLFGTKWNSSRKLIVCTESSRSPEMDIWYSSPIDRKGEFGKIIFFGSEFQKGKKEKGRGERVKPWSMRGRGN